MSCVLNLLRRFPARLRANDPDPESYETKVRVLSLMCMTVLSTTMVYGVLWNGLRPPPSPIPVGFFFMLGAMVGWFSSWWVVIIWALILGRTTPKMMDAMIGSSLFACFLAVTGSPYYDAAYVASTLFTALSFVMGAVYWRVWVAVCTLLAFVNSYNRVAFHAGWHPAAIDPFGQEHMTTFTYVVSTSGYFLGTVIHFAALLLQHLEYVRATAAARAAEQVTATIAVKLRVYDTAAAAEALKHEAAERVDKELKESFTALVENLESYRPYLPNWLLASTDADVDDADAATISTKGSELEHSRSSPAAVALPDASIQSVESMRTGKDPAASFSSEGGRWVRGPGSDRSSHRSGTTSPRRPHALDARRHYASAPTAALEKRSYLKGTVTFAVIEYVTEDVPDSSLSETLTAVADAVHRCAAECKGAVHTMLLGEIVVSWNVATRVAGPEAKAAKFLLSLKTALAGDDNVHHSFRAVAAAASHHARSETIGTNKKLLTSERSGPLRFKLRGILRFAWAARAVTRRNERTTPPLLSVVLLDERTTQEASSNFIISAGAVLDLAAYLPTSDMSDLPLPLLGDVPEMMMPAATAAISSVQEVTHAADGPGTAPASVSLRPCFSPNGATLREVSLPAQPQSKIHRSSHDLDAERRLPLPPRARGSTMKGPSVNHLNDQHEVSPSTRHVATGVVAPVGHELVTLLDKTADPVLDSTRPLEQEVVHVFDLVSPRTGGDDEWLYAMEEGAADAARAAQLMVGAGLRRQSGGVDAAAVRAAFEEAGKQRDGACIMARPLVRQLMDGIASDPTRA